MSTITAILEADADGTLHLPLPPELRGKRIKVEAKLLSAETSDSAAPEGRGFGALRGKIRMARDFDEPIADFKEYME